MTFEVRLILAVLTVYRLAELVAIDDGPGSIFLSLRTWLGAYQYDASGRPARAAGRFVSCRYCLGIWFAIVAGAFVMFPNIVTDAGFLIFGIAGAQSALCGICNR